LFTYSLWNTNDLMNTIVFIIHAINYRKLKEEGVNNFV